MGEEIETGITVLFAWLSSRSKTWLKCWWNNDNYFSLFSFSSPHFSHYLFQFCLSTSPQHGWFICLQHNIAQQGLATVHIATMLICRTPGISQMYFHTLSFQCFPFSPFVLSPLSLIPFPAAAHTFPVSPPVSLSLSLFHPSLFPFLIRRM